MSRSSSSKHLVRRIAPLLGLLAHPAAAALPAAVTLSAVVMGCQDENDPKVIAGTLSDPAKQTQAVKRLIQKYEDALTNDKKDRQGPTVKPLLDQIIDPMTKLCTDGQMSDQTRSMVVKFLADTWDTRATPCLSKVLTDFKPGTNEGDVQQVMRAVAQTKNKDLADGVIKVFSTLKASDPGSMQDNMYKDVQAATLAVVNDSHVDTLVGLLARNLPDDPKKNQKDMLNETFWQGIAATALGDLKAAKAVTPLIKVILSPGKNSSVIGSNALIALVKIGKPVIAPAKGLLTGSADAAELIKYSTDENLKTSADIKDPKQLEAAKKSAEKSHIAVAAQILGQLGREDALEPLLTVLDTPVDAKATDEQKAQIAQTTAIIAYQLPNLPKTDKSVAAFKTVYENLKNEVTMPNGDGAKEKLLGAAVNFADANLVPWILDQCDKLKGEPSDLESIQVASLLTSMSLMKADQTDAVRKLFDKKGADGKTALGKAFSKEWDSVTGVLTECKDGVDCYLAKAGDPKSQDKDGSAAGLKAVYMIEILGKSEAKAKLLDNLPKYSHPGIKQQVLSAILYFSPKGDKDAADKLQAIVDKAEASKDQEAIQDAQPLKQTVALLNARAQ